MTPPVRSPDIAAASLPLDHVALRVRSAATSARYYAALLPLLGFRQAGESRWFGGGLLLQFDEAAADTSDYDRFAPGMNHLGFRARSLADVEGIQAAMRRAGFDAPELQWFGEIAALFLRDPDGIRFEIAYDPNGARRQ